LKSYYIIINNKHEKLKENICLIIAVLYIGPKCKNIKPIYIKIYCTVLRDLFNIFSYVSCDFINSNDL